MKFLIVSPSFFPATYYGGQSYFTYEFMYALKEDEIEIRLNTNNVD